MKLSDLSPNPKNPRKITDEKLKMLEASLEEFGPLDGVIYNEATKRLAGGHQRKKIDPSAPITITQRYDVPTKTGTVAEGYVILKGERTPFRIVRWDEIKEKAANIAANKGGGEWDFPQLTEWFIELDHANFNLDLTMFDATERENIVVGKEEPNEGLCDADEVPEVHAEPRTKRGDIYSMGRHRLLCGDSTDRADVERLMAGEKADMVFTDPPYNVGLEYGEYDDSVVEQDKWVKTCRQWYEQWKTVADRIVLTPGCNNLELWCRLGNPTHIAPWVKKNGQTTGRITHLWVWEPIFFFGKFKRKRATDLFEHHVMSGFLRKHQEAPVEKGEHPCPKPLALWTDIVENFSETSEIIFDPFLGSGSTLIACEKTNRRCYGMEIDPHYVDVCVARWEKFTGNKAVLENNAMQ